MCVCVCAWICQLQSEIRLLQTPSPLWHGRLYGWYRVLAMGSNQCYAFNWILQYLSLYVRLLASSLFSRKPHYIRNVNWCTKICVFMLPVCYKQKRYLARHEIHCYQVNARWTFLYWSPLLNLHPRVFKRASWPSLAKFASDVFKLPFSCLLAYDETSEIRLCLLIKYWSRCIFSAGQTKLWEGILKMIAACAFY